MLNRAGKRHGKATLSSVKGDGDHGRLLIIRQRQISGPSKKGKKVLCYRPSSLTSVLEKVTQQTLLGSCFQTHEGKEMTGNSWQGFSKDELYFINLFVLNNERTCSMDIGKALGVTLALAKPVT